MPQNQSHNLPSTERHDPYAALRIAGFRTFTLVRFLLTVAIQIQSVTVGFTIFQLTKDALALGLIGLTEAIPSLTIALYAGHTADVRSRKTIVLVALGALVMCSFALMAWAATSPAVALLDTHNLRGAHPSAFAPVPLHAVWPVYAIIFISGIARGFMGPATSGLAAQIIPPEFYANATSWSSSTWQTASVLGPALGGLLYGFYGSRIALSVDAVLMVCAWGFMTLVPRTPVPPQKASIPVLQSVQEGLRFVFSNQIILASITLDLFAVFFGGVVALLPVFTTDVLGVPNQLLGILRAAPAVGAVLMGLWLAHNPIRENAGRRLFIAVAAFGISIIGFAFSRSFIVSFLLLTLYGAFDNISVVIRSTLIQLHTPDAMRGRVSSVNSIFIGSSNELGEFESGVAARLLGVVPSVIFGGCMTLLVVLITYFKAPRLREMQNLQDTEAGA